MAAAAAAGPPAAGISRNPRRRTRRGQEPPAKRQKAEADDTVALHAGSSVSLHAAWERLSAAVCPEDKDERALWWSAHGNADSAQRAVAHLGEHAYSCFTLLRGICDLDYKAGAADIFVGREKELATIESFVKAVYAPGSCSDGSSGFLYISGRPGSGKTSAVEHVLKQASQSAKGQLFAWSYMDCAERQSEDQVLIWTTICEELAQVAQGEWPHHLRRAARPRGGAGGKLGDAASVLKAIEQVIDEDIEHTKHGLPPTTAPLRMPLIMVLDELDHAVTRKRGRGTESNPFLFNMLELARESPKLSFIGIANRENLIDTAADPGRRDRVQSRANVRREQLPFAAYRPDQLEDILRARFGKLHKETALPGEPVRRLLEASQLVSRGGDGLVREEVYHMVAHLAHRHWEGDCRKLLELADLALQQRLDTLPNVSMTDSSTVRRSADLIPTCENWQDNFQLGSAQVQAVRKQFVSAGSVQKELEVTRYERAALAAVLIQATCTGADDRVVRRTAVAQRLERLLRHPDLQQGMDLPPAVPNLRMGIWREPEDFDAFWGPDVIGLACSRVTFAFCLDLVQHLVHRGLMRPADGLLCDTHITYAGGEFAAGTIGTARSLAKVVFKDPVLRQVEAVQKTLEHVAKDQGIVDIQAGHMPFRPVQSG
eukprot:TRINITY_DN47557_c0_g1_i1.p1 TRINITY_DN47557_c0_g1~~TRINITY_DN47557_c0_g1_i1.p1  ORF type:complete len:681 (+),score=165.25 TRINITY_DN47557_c0_g1_i1:71-2044(+)